MARPGVTYDQVATVANHLFEQGNQEPGIKAVREELAKRAGPGAPTGSPNTIQRHLNAWREKGRPVGVADNPMLPQQLAGDLARALTAAADASREKAEIRLAQVLLEQQELITLGEATEVRVGELQLELAERTTERDQLAGQVTELSRSTGALQAEVTQARQLLSEQARDLTRAQADVQTATARFEEVRAAAERDRTSAQQDLAHARELHDASHLRAGEQEVRAATAEARAEGLQEAKRLLEAQVSELVSTAKRLESEVLRTAAVEGEAGGLREQVRLLTETNNMLRNMMKASGALGS